MIIIMPLRVLPALNYMVNLRRYFFICLINFLYWIEPAMRPCILSTPESKVLS